MIQRIQTVYLLLVVALFAATIFMPLAVFQSGDELFRLDVTGLSTMTVESELIYPTWSMLGLAVIACLLAFVAIFLFKNRVVQMRVCVYNMLLMIGFYGLFIYWVYQIKGGMEEATLSVRLALSFPFVALILNYLAIRNIGADEVLVRSLNRLR